MSKSPKVWVQQETKALIVFCFAIPPSFHKFSRFFQALKFQRFRQVKIHDGNIQVCGSQQKKPAEFRSERSFNRNIERIHENMKTLRRPWHVF